MADALKPDPWKIPGDQWKTYRHADNSPIMGEYSFMTEPDYWENEVDTDYLEVVEDTWQLVESRTIRFGRTDTWCTVCEEEFELAEPAPPPHYCAKHQPDAPQIP